MFKKIILLALYTISCICFAYASKNYPTVGSASYYSKNDKCDPFSHTTTASGEKFDDSKLTCAMRHRDFGHYYKVTNLENKKSVIVKHNDYGPSKRLFNENRIIDLSKAAFKAISKLEKGVIKVEIAQLK